MNKKSQVLKYVKFEQNSLQLVIFTKSFFANNKDLFLQIGFIIYLVDLIYKVYIIY